MTGHLLGASGGLESAVTALAVRDGIVPPTINYETPDPSCDLDCVPNKARRMPIRAALNNSFGFGGTNASLLLTRHDAMKILVCIKHVPDTEAKIKIGADGKSPRPRAASR